MRVTLQLSGGVTSEEGSLKPVTLSGRPFYVGRAPDADWTLLDPRGVISGRHLELRTEGRTLVVIDHSTNGTSINTKANRLQKGQPAKLPDSCVLVLPIGQIDISVERDEPAAHSLDDGEDFFGLDEIEAERNRVRRGPAEPELNSDALLGGGASLSHDDTTLPDLGLTDSPASPPRPDDPSEGLSASALVGGGGGGGGGGGVTSAPTAPDYMAETPPPPATPPAADPAPSDDWMAEDDDIFGPAPADPQASPSAAEALAPSQPAEPVPQPAPERPITVPPLPDPAPGGALGAAPGANGGMELPATPGTATDQGLPVADIPVPDVPVAPVAAPVDVPAGPTPPEAPAAPAPAPVTSGAASSAASGAAEAALRALFAELGRDNYDMMTDAQRHEMAVHVGKTFGAMADAIRQMLETRADVKRALGVTATELGIGANPLKFARTRKAALDGLIQPLSDGILHGEDAVDDSLHSMQAHQYAMISGIKAALQTALKEFDPLLIEKHLEQGTVGKLVPGSRKRALWDSFTENYARFREQAEENFRVVIGRELDKLYHTQRPRGDDPQ